MKIVYYGFGAFIGFLCGITLNFVFFFVEKSGHPLMSNLIENYGILGQYLVTMINSLPYFGLAAGLVMIRMMFKDRWDRKEEDDNPQT